MHTDIYPHSRSVGHTLGLLVTNERAGDARARFLSLARFPLQFHGCILIVTIALFCYNFLIVVQLRDVLMTCICLCECGCCVCVLCVCMCIGALMCLLVEMFTCACVHVWYNNSKKSQIVCICSFTLMTGSHSARSRVRGQVQSVPATCLTLGPCCC